MDFDLLQNSFIFEFDFLNTKRFTSRNYRDKNMKIGITCYPTYGGSGVIATELGKELALTRSPDSLYKLCSSVQINTVCGKYCFS